MANDGKLAWPVVHLELCRLDLSQRGRKSGLVGSKLDSRSIGRGFESCSLLDGNDVKVMPGSIPEKHPILVRTKKKDIQVAKWGTPKKYLKRNRFKSKVFIETIKEMPFA